jgi:hypothetical protein
MRWRLEFYHERRGVLARYGIDAPLPAEAVRLGWAAVLAEHPSMPRRGAPGLFERARRAGGHDASGWVLYRLGRDGERGSPGNADREHSGPGAGAVEDGRPATRPADEGGAA